MMKRLVLAFLLLTLVSACSTDDTDGPSVSAPDVANDGNQGDATNDMTLADGGPRDGSSDLLGTNNPDSNLTCSPPSRLCGTQCVRTESDPLHCGDCFIDCDPGEACDNGDCFDPGDCREVGCVGLSWCDQLSGDCIPGCDRNQQCASADAHCNQLNHQCECDAGFHECGECVANADVAHCGGRCSPCPTDPNGTATCDGTSCGLTCDSGALLCNGRCGLCPVVDHATFTCSGTACVVDECDDNYLYCGGSCAPCPTDGVGEVACAGGACVMESCAPGFHTCAEGCCPWTVVDLEDAIGTAQMDLDGNGRPHIVGAPWTGGALRYWIVGAEVTDDTVVPSNSEYPLIHLDGAGTSHVLFWSEEEGVFPYALRYAWDDAVDGWSNEELWVANSFGSGDIVEHAGTLYVVSDRLFHYGVAGDWEHVNLHEGALPGAARLAVAPDGGVFLAYQELDSDSTVLSRFLGGTSFERETIVEEEWGVVGLFFTADGAPHVWYCDVDGALGHAQRDGEGWVSETVLPEDGWCFQNEVELGPSGFHILHRDNATGQYRYLRPNGSGWDTHIVAQVEASYLPVLELELDSVEQPHIVYTRRRSGTAAFVSYATW